MDPNQLFDEAARQQRRAVTKQPTRKSSCDALPSQATCHQPNRKHATAECVDPPIHRYLDGNVYREARGRDATRDRVEYRDLRSAMAVVDLRHESIRSASFVVKMVREMKIRNYKRKTILTYRDAIKSFLRWTGRQPHEIDRELVREYLEFLFDCKKGRSSVSGHLSAIRTIFDKFCLLDITLGICTPRKDKKLPVVLSKDEVLRLLEAAVSMRDKLLLGLMYATGVRVGEVVKICRRDIDLDRNLISIWEGKGKVDRQVMVPESYRELFACLKKRYPGEAFLFPSEANHRQRLLESRYLSPRTVQRVMKSTLALAGIDKPATPHSLRHSFATHSFEDGFDIRRIQKILGHTHLDTTTLYVKTANPDNAKKMSSPLDALKGSRTKAARREAGRAIPFRVHCKRFAGEPMVRVTIELRSRRGPIYLTGAKAEESRPGFWTLRVPLQESWDTLLTPLSSAQREYLGDSQFYEDVRAEILAALMRMAGVVGS